MLRRCVKRWRGCRGLRRPVGRLQLGMGRELGRVPEWSRRHWVRQGWERGKKRGVWEVPWCNGEHSGL